MIILKFDGTPTEFETVRYLFEAAPEPADPVTHVSTSSPATPDPVLAGTSQTATAAEAFFTRRPLPADQKSVLKVVFDAGQTGITTSELAAATGIAEARTIRATIMLLGKRAAHTPGRPKVFRQQWQGHQNRYWLNDSVRSLISSGRVKL